MKKVYGSKVRELRTIGSMYADGNIVVLAKSDNEYRIHVDELVKMFKYFEFETEEKRVHTYLINPKYKSEEK